MNRPKGRPKGSERMLREAREANAALGRENDELRRDLARVKPQREANDALQREINTLRRDAEAAKQSALDFTREEALALIMHLSGSHAFIAGRLSLMGGIADPQERLALDRLMERLFQKLAEKALEVQKEGGR